MKAEDEVRQLNILNFHALLDVAIPFSFKPMFHTCSKVLQVSVITSAMSTVRRISLQLHA
jgi:hypothetical protein